MEKQTRRITLNARIRPELNTRLRAVTVDNPDPYAPTQTAVIERGIELALEEWNARHAARAENGGG